MEEKINAIMLRGVDYKDNDKMLTLYSIERGLVSASVRGVKKAGAKLNFCAQPFCFAEYLLSVNQTRATVIGATEIESFYNLRVNLTSFYCATVICEYLIKGATEEGNEELFMLAVNGLKKLNFSTENGLEVLANFLLQALNQEGYAISGANCFKCGEPAHLGEYAYFDFERGQLLCCDCFSPTSTRILSVTAEALQNLFSGQSSECSSLKYLLKFLAYYVNKKLGFTLNSIDELLEVII